MPRIRCSGFGVCKRCLVELFPGLQHAELRSTKAGGGPESLQMTAREPWWALKDTRCKPRGRITIRLNEQTERAQHLLECLHRGQVRRRAPEGRRELYPHFRPPQFYGRLADRL